MTDPYPFLNDAPEGFEPTMELKWFECDENQAGNVATYTSDGAEVIQPSFMVLCQKWRGAFRDVWVRIPIETP